MMGREGPGHAGPAGPPSYRHTERTGWGHQGSAQTPRGRNGDILGADLSSEQALWVKREEVTAAGNQKRNGRVGRGSASWRVLEPWRWNGQRGPGRGPACLRLTWGTYNVLGGAERGRPPSKWPGYRQEDVTDHVTREPSQAQ